MNSVNLYEELLKHHAIIERILMKLVKLTQKIIVILSVMQN